LSGLERRLVRRYGRTPGARIRLAAGLRALAVLAGRHPRAMADMVAAGALQAARTGVQELSGRLRGWEEAAPAGAAAAEPGAEAPRALTRREWRRFRKLLDRAGRGGQGLSGGRGVP
jgi:hypothetical protein